MSCDAAAAAFLFLASASPASPAPGPVPAVATAPKPVAQQPLFASIVVRAAKLKTEVEAYRTPALKASAGLVQLPGFDKFQARIGELADLDMQGHLELAKTGQDGDLKCILKGISQDLPLKLKDLMQAQTGAAEDSALRDMAYLLRDNVEVITAPPTPPA
jgi:hypothetical protein